jgi:hypothetical protein
MVTMFQKKKFPMPIAAGFEEERKGDMNEEVDE